MGVSSKEERPVAKCGVKLLNASKNHWRGVVSTVLMMIIIIAFCHGDNIYNPKKKIVALWLWMFVFMVLRPMDITASALIILFSPTLFGVMSSDNCCNLLCNENTILFFLGGWLQLLVNNCRLDKRMICGFMAVGDKTSITPMKLLLRSSTAAFFVSALSNRDLVTRRIIQYLKDATQPLLKDKKETNYKELTDLLVISTAISSLLGSLCIMHASVNAMLMRSMHSTSGSIMLEYPDVFNYLNYSAWAVPTAIVMFLLNLGYQAILVAKCTGPTISISSREKLKIQFDKNREELGRMTYHEMISIVFLILMFGCFFFRWSPWLKMGWATFRADPVSSTVCSIKDATTAAIFVVLLNMLPKSFNFTKIWRAKQEKDCPVMKIESSILFWKFIDKHTDYSLLFVFGAGSILCILFARIALDIPGTFGDAVTQPPYPVGLLAIVLVSVVLGTIMNGLGAQVCFMPLMFTMALYGKGGWPLRRHQVALAVGVGTALGFMLPFEHSPSYHVKDLGKVGWKKQCKYSVASSLICAIVLWLSLCFFAPVLWDPVEAGRGPVLAGVGGNRTLA